MFVKWPVTLKRMKCEHVKIVVIRMEGYGLPGMLDMSTVVNRDVDTTMGWCMYVNEIVLH